MFKTKNLLVASWLLAAAIVFVVAAIMADPYSLNGLELVLFRLINDLPEWLRLPMLAVTQLGSAGMFLITAVVVVLLKQSRLAGLVILNGVTGYLAVVVLKPFISRPRPFVILEGVHQRELVSGFGFPSGHAAMATVLSLTLALYLKGKWRFLPLIWIPLVGLSRVYLGVHSPLDIVGGIALGSVVVLVGCLLNGLMHKSAKA